MKTDFGKVLKHSTIRHMQSPDASGESPLIPADVFHLVHVLEAATTATRHVGTRSGPRSGGCGGIFLAGQVAASFDLAR